METTHQKDTYWGGIVKAMGLVFGDIGTSPIYTLTVIFALTAPTATMFSASCRSWSGP